MEQYINKAALVAEIESFREELQDKVENSDFIAGEVFIMNYFLSFLDTLEVKEVDLEKELNNFIEQQKAFVKDDRVVEYNNGDTFNHIYDLEDIAKHFFELGIQASSNISIEVTSIDEELKENGIDPNSKEAKIIKESYYTAIERLIAQKGE